MSSIILYLILRACLVLYYIPSYNHVVPVGEEGESCLLLDELAEEVVLPGDGEDREDLLVGVPGSQQSGRNRQDQDQDQDQDQVPQQRQGRGSHLLNTDHAHCLRFCLPITLLNK